MDTDFSFARKVQVLPSTVIVSSDKKPTPSQCCEVLEICERQMFICIIRDVGNDRGHRLGQPNNHSMNVDTNPLSKYAEALRSLGINHVAK